MWLCLSSAATSLLLYTQWRRKGHGCPLKSCCAHYNRWKSARLHWEGLLFFLFFLSAGINLHISIVTHLPPCLNMPRSSRPNYLREAADNNCVDCEPSAPQAHRVAAKVFEQENGAGGGLEHVVMISMTVLRLAAATLSFREIRVDSLLPPGFLQLCQLGRCFFLEVLCLVWKGSSIAETSWPHLTCTAGCSFLELLPL